MRTIRLILTVWMLALAGSADAALVFSTGAAWKYFKGRSEASSPDNTAWRRIDFNDATFTAAQAPFWYGDTLPGGTQLTDMLNQYTCVFLRRTFVLTNIADISALRFGAACDDGFIGWINGVEVQRYNMAAGNIAFNGVSPTAVAEPPPFNTYDLLNPGSYLVLGTNVIAIQVFNAGIGSSDLGFDCSLSTTAPDPIPPVVATKTPAPGQVSALTSITVTFSEPVAGVNASDFLINGTPASAMTGGNDTYTFSFPQPAYGPVSVTWVSSHGIADFGVPPNAFNAAAPGNTWQYNLLDNVAPTVAYQLPFAGVTVRSLNQIEVNFSEAVTGVDAEDLLVNGVAATSVTPLSPGQFVFGFAQPAVGTVQVEFAAGHGIRDLAAAPNNFAGASWSYVLDPDALLDTVRLNELAAANVNGLRDEDNEVQDWVELYNTGSNAVSLAGWSLTDDEDEPAKWVFPPVSIPGRGYLIVFCSGKDRKPVTPGSRLHSNFGLSPDGEFLGLYNAEVPRRLVSSFNPYPNQRTDYSWGYDPQDQLKYFQTQTPGAVNGASTITGVVADTKFSHDRGFYTAPFSLSITCATPGVTIRYTTNGSPPTATTGLIYSSPIPIAGTKIVRAAAYRAGLLPSDVDAQTYLFLDDVIRQANEVTPGPGWPAQKKANGNGQNMDYGMDPRITVTNHAATIKDDLLAVPTYSIVMDIGQFSNMYTNPGGDTIAWERPASIELIYPDDTKGFQINCGIRIRGGFSRSPDNPKHAFRLFFRQEYGASKLNYPVFGPTGAREFDKFDLRTMQNYSWSFQNDSRMICLRDVMSRDAQLTMNGLSTRGNFYHLYINGHYWGLYNTEERPEAAFAESYIGGRAEDYDTIKQLDGYTSGPTDGNADAWYRLWYAATNGFASDADYFRVQGLNVDGTPNPAYENLLDVPNLIDYMLVILYGGNLDAPISNFLQNDSPNNWYGFRDRTGRNGGFRFVSHDAEHTLLNVNEDRTGLINLAATTPPNTFGVINPDWTCGNPLTQAGGPAQAIIRSTPQYIWFRLHENAEFRILAADRIQKHLFTGGPLSVEGMRAAFNARSNEIQRAIVAESARWGDAKSEPGYTRDTWLSAMNGTVGFLNGRTAVLLNQLRADGTFPSNNAPVFSSRGGAVPAGFALYMTNSNASGTIYYTTDGRDPRQRGGNVSPFAVAYTPGTPILINNPVTVRARVRNGAIWSAITEATFYPAQDFSGLLFTEIMYNPLGVGATAGEEFEFLELKNTGTNTIDLSRATFDGINFTFTNGTRLAPSQFFVLGRNATTLGARYPGLVLHGIYSGRLDNAGETITILHPLGTKIIAVDYKDGGKWPITADGFGFSIVPRTPNANPNPDSPSNWRASTNPGGSPGEDDPAPTVAGIVINEALTHTDPPLLDFIELHNPTTTDVNIGGWFLTDDGKAPFKFRIPDNTTIAAGGYVVFTEADFNPTPGTNGSFTLSSQGEEVYLLSAGANTNLTGYSHGFGFGAAANGVSFGRHVISTGDERFVAQISRTPGAANAGPLVGPVVIREIMYHPPDLLGGLDNSDDEYIELRNTSGVAVSLYHPLYQTNTWRVRGGVDFDFPPNTSLAGGQSLLLVNFNPTNTALLAAFRAKYALFAGLAVFGPYSGKLDNSSDTISLRKPDAPDTNGTPYIVVDDVDYKDAAPWTPAPDGTGAALQRVDLAAYADDPANWIGVAPLSITSITVGGVSSAGASLSLAVRAGTNAATATNVAFTVSAIGTGTLTFQWRKNGEDIPGATNASFTILDAQLPDEGVYSVRVSDLAGSVQSPSAYLFVYTVASLSVVQSPGTQSVVSGGQVTLSATVAGAPPPFTFEWRRNLPAPSMTNAQVSLERTSFHIYTAPVLTNSLAITQQWRLVVKNLASSTGVSPGVFNLIILPDSDGDGLPDSWEAANGLNPTTAGDALLDTDGDGLSNREEYIAGTNPLDAASCLKVTQVSISSPAQITFEAVSNKTYTIQYTDDLNLAAWLNLTNVVARTNTRPETVFDSRPSTNRFYRIATPQVP
jgi:hypothetical protein